MKKNISDALALFGLNMETKESVFLKGTTEVEIRFAGLDQIANAEERIGICGCYPVWVALSNTSFMSLSEAHRVIIAAIKSAANSVEGSAKALVLDALEKVMLA